MPKKKQTYELEALTVYRVLTYYKAQYQATKYAWTGRGGFALLRILLGSTRAYSRSTPVERNGEARFELYKYMCTSHALTLLTFRYFYM